MTEPTDAAAEADVSVGRVEFSVEWPPGHVAAYHVDGPELTLVDAGMDEQQGREELREGLADRGYDLADVDNLLVTHPHIDHIGQTNTLIEAADPSVYAPAGVRDRFDRDLDDLRTTVEAHAEEAGVFGEYLEEAVDMSVESLERNRELLDPDTVDVWVEDGETVSVSGVDLDAVHAPGHQADHLCFHGEVGGQPVLLSGDMALPDFRPVALHTGLDDGYQDTIGAFYGALDRRAELDEDRVYHGHGQVHSDFQAALERDRDSLDRLLSDALESLGEDGKSAVEFAMERAGDRDIRHMLFEAIGALAHLERQGKAVSRVEDGTRKYVTA